MSVHTDMSVTAVLVAGALPLVARVVFLLLLDGDRDKDDSTGRLIPPPRCKILQVFFKRVLTYIGNLKSILATLRKVQTVMGTSNYCEQDNN